MKASLVIDYHLNNAIFNLNDKNINRDNYAYSVWLLKKQFQKVDVDLSTCDINSPEESNAVLYFDFPEQNVEINPEISYLFLFESEVIKPKSWDMIRHEKFKKIFTWNDELVDNKKYFKFNYCHLFPTDKVEFNKILIKFSNKKLCTLISANKKVIHPYELYSQRVKTIRWFESNAPLDFDLYGIGWDKYRINNKYIRFLLSKIPFLGKIFAPKFSSYKGVVESKNVTLSEYKFSICYENAEGLSGYITEKIFDCFFAGCVPIYWGAPNIVEHIPDNCFIDRRQFDSHEKLYEYLINISEVQYLDFQKNIANYLFSEKSVPYRAETFANTIVDHVIKDIK